MLSIVFLRFFPANAHHRATGGLRWLLDLVARSRRMVRMGLGPDDYDDGEFMDGRLVVTSIVPPRWRRRSAVALDAGKLTGALCTGRLI